MGEILMRRVAQAAFFAVYFLVVMPVALLMRLVGRDAMRLRTWRSTPTLFKDSHHLFVRDDMKTTF